LKSLIDLSNHYGSDKGTTTPKQGWGRPHNYADIYQAYFSDIREEPLTILEIGAGVLGPNWETGIVGGRNPGGASIRMWYDFFPKARIVTIDINPAGFLENDRIEAYTVDQGSEESLAGFLSQLGATQFDIVIDDGSHVPEHQQTSLGMLFGAVKPGGLYFIEDLLKNGRGDNSKRRNASNEVYSTLSVLKALCEEGRLKEPHRIGHPEAFTASVKYINWHCPRITPILVDRETGAGPADSRMQGKATKPWFEFDVDFPMLCAIRKKK